MQFDIQERTFDFAISVINKVESVPETIAGKVICGQLLRSGTSVGANVEEADAAFTKNVFAYKMNIALSEARETHYWLRLLLRADLVQHELCSPAIGEAAELKKIPGAIVSRARRKPKS